ncbi:N-acetylmuramoyl-L-alanine amidase [Streptomyces microflavus]|uniref:N-acetylmuramoyl-L-alanine amidase n=1 Tax=Streptomyces microflavus TaxID=1919 RepID=UPI00225424C8|nr:N-acetylmuramoyl-L-alanine amidase [Streptomyces microflavus]MCX4652039.1 N-acetylmuramoyl-L-alanine amidase [Streptomyces microflavus]WSS37029.1 N-acetylmuramoyl-L-alanine amidase [Streptomyces microflavus]WST14519.1 N-acetylmuramoyl-L-alanine amidase [Streptomyces microflavus]
MPYDDSVPPTRRARPLLLAAALAALCLTTVAGCGGSPDTTDGAGADASPSATPTAPASPSPSPTEPLPQGPLTGRTVVIDPGHNPRNREHTKEINEKVDIGTGRKECDTTGTSTDAGYPEARFTLDVSHRLQELLQAQGARVLLTHDEDRPFGPCIDERARIGNEAKADAVVSVHADGSAVGNRGFHVILPAAVKGGGADTSKIVKSSADLGARIAGHFVRTTGSAPSNYIGGGTGLDTRNDLGGLNLSTVPKVFVECGNMRDPKDAALLTSASWRQKAAQGMADGIADHLKG